MNKPHDGERHELTFAQYIEILHRRRWIAATVGLLTFGAAAAYAFLGTPIYRCSTLINIERESNSNTNTILGVDDDTYVDTQFKLIASDSALERVYDSLQLASSRDFGKLGLRALKKAVSVTAVPHTRLCNVNVDSSDPALAMKISATLSQYFVEQNLNSQLFMSKDVLDALQARITGNDAQKIRESLPQVVNNKLVQDIKAQIFAAEAQLADLRQKDTEKHPAVIALKSRIESMHKVLNNEVDNIVQSLKTELSGQLRGNNVRIIDMPRMPDRPLRPRKVLTLAFGFIGGLFLALIAALTTETLDQTVRSHEDIEVRLGLPFLGQIPHTRHRKADPRVYAHLLSNEPSLTGEAFRNLRTMLNFAEAYEHTPMLIVTSTVQEEGKSFVSANLAVALAQVGQKVLLVDGDLRRPRQHRNLKLSNERGLSEFLACEYDDPAAAIQRTEIEGLEALACGTRPPNPAELLNTERLTRFVAWAKENYTKVIVDCPPVFPISDVLLWGRHIRSAIIVSRFGRTRLPLIKSACARLRVGEIKILGGVVNGARLRSMSYADGRYYEQYYSDYTDDKPARGRA